MSVFPNWPSLSFHLRSQQSVRSAIGSPCVRLRSLNCLLLLPVPACAYACAHVHFVVYCMAEVACLSLTEFQDQLPPCLFHISLLRQIQHSIIPTASVCITLARIVRKPPPATRSKEANQRKSAEAFPKVVSMLARQHSGLKYWTTSVNASPRGQFTEDGTPCHPYRWKEFKCQSVCNTIAINCQGLVLS